MKITEEKLKFVELRAKGLSFDKCSEELGKSKNTLIDWNRELEDDISNLKSMALESLYEEFFISKVARIRTIAKTLKSVNEELERRDLTEVSTNKLIELAIKLDTKLGSEILEPQFSDSIKRQFNEIKRGFPN